MTTLETISKLFSFKTQKTDLMARQMLMLQAPLSKTVEAYLYDNDGRPQSLAKFPMLRAVYDNMPQRLLLKCSRKTLKSTLLSNVMAINMVRYNYYKMLYIGPNEAFTKLFSSSYLSARFESPNLKKIISGLHPNHVFYKVVKDTHSELLLKYASDDATRIRGPAADCNLYDEIQDMDYDIIGIVRETMAISNVKREIYAGTPLTTDNTINTLWKKGHQFEWVMKCGSCNHWNSLTKDNKPEAMVQPMGLSCSKCSNVLNSSEGQWVDFNRGSHDSYGYHLAQPILPYFNQDTKQWAEIYRKCKEMEAESPKKLYNEVFGLDFDVGRTGITEEELRSLCVLGPMKDCYNKRYSRYLSTALGADWGVNMETSRTVGCCGGLREDGIIEIFFAVVFRDTDYDGQIQALARKAREYNCFVAADSGPDPNRGKALGNSYNPQRTQLVRYGQDKFIQRQDTPAGAIDWSQTRWVLHRSDTITLIFNLLKKGRILFPDWEDCSIALLDLLNVNVEIKEGPLKADLYYSRKAELADDFLHALNYTVCQLLVWANDPLLEGFSSSSAESHGAV